MQPVRRACKEPPPLCPWTCSEHKECSRIQKDLVYRPRCAVSRAECFGRFQGTARGFRPRSRASLSFFLHRYDHATTIVNMQVVTLPEPVPVKLSFDREQKLSLEGYLAFIRANPDLRVERTAEGEIII